LSNLPSKLWSPVRRTAWSRLVLAGLSAAGLFVAGCTLESPSGTPSAASGSGAAAAGSNQSNGGERKSSAGGDTTGDSTQSNSELTLGGVKPAADDTLVLNYHDDPDTLNPVTSHDTTSESLQRNVYQPLAQRRYSDPDQWEPVLAESWEFDKDKLEYTIHLRKGVKWHPMALPSGKALPSKEFTARDVKFTFDCILNQNVEAAHLRSYYEDPDATEESEKYKIKVSVVDDYTVKIRWSKPYFLSDDYSLDILMAPRHVFSVDEQGEPISFDFGSKEFADGFNNHWANTKMCGTGPLRFKEWKKQDSVQLERNPDYWGAPYAFSRVLDRCITNNNTALQLVLQNELDWSGIPEKDQFLQAKDNSNVKADKVILETYAYPAYRYIGYNEAQPYFKDKRVRWALAHAIPVEQIIEKVYYGLADRLTGPFLPGSSSYDDSLEPIPFDLAKARELLDAAGWKDSDGDGVRDQEIDGKRVPFEFDLIIYSDSAQFLTIAEIMKENCRQIGIKVHVTPTKWALMLQKLRKKEFDACILGWALSWKSDPFQIFHSSQADVPESSNSIGYKNPEVDKLIETLRVTMEPEEQAKLLQQIHRIVYDDQPYTFLFRDKATAGRDARLQNVDFFKIRPCVDSRQWYGKTARMID
jgi:peptide/nickel transport system substrate-binding protein